MLTYQIMNSSRMNYYTHQLFCGKSFSSHFHSSYEALFAVRGESSVTADQQSFLLNEGEMCLIMSNQIHSFKVGPGSRLWVIVFSQDLVDSFRQETEKKAFPHPVFRPSDRLLEMMPLAPGSDFADAFLLRAFLWRLCHEFCSQVSAAPNLQVESVSTVHRIFSFIAAHYTQDITLQSLARQFGLNAAYISSLINGITHQNFRSFLNSYRVEHARRLLRSTALSITDIAYESGFNTLRTFNRAFQEEEGLSPHQYRAREEKTGASG